MGLPIDRLSSRLPRRFPVGAKYVVEGYGGEEGKLRVIARYVVAREEANSGRFELNGEVGGDQDSKHQEPQPLNEAAEVIADGGEHGVDGIAA
jgi:hypothetical protein